MKYLCEICNKQFDTPDEARVCEYTHKKEQMNQAAKEAAAAKISDAINAFIAKYGEAPSIHFTDENEEIVLCTVVNGLQGMVNVLFGALADGDDDVEYEDCCERCSGHCDCKVNGTE